MKKVVLIVLLVIFLSLIVFAQELPEQPVFNQKNTIEWLVNNTNENIEFQDLVFSIIALNKVGKREQVASLLERLNGFQSEEGCFPELNCNTIDTSLAMLALGSTGNDVNKQLEWLKGNLRGYSEGEWRIQIEGEGPEGAECIVSYSEDPEIESGEKRFTLKGNRINGPAGDIGYFINIAAHLNNGLLNSQKSVIVTDCRALQRAVISLIHVKGNNYYILKEKEGKADFKIPNGCFAQSDLRNNCDYESSVYAAFAIKEILGNEKLEEMGVKTYLQSNLQNDNLYRAILGRTFGEKSFLQELVETQSLRDGSWDNNIFSTAMAVISLQGFGESDSFSRGRKYLENTVSINGAWFEKIRETSISLIALMGGDFGKGNVAPVVTTSGTSISGTSDNEICDNELDDDGDGFFDCNDGSCFNFPGCECFNLKLDVGEEGIDCGGGCDKTCSTFDGDGTKISPDFPEPGGDFGSADVGSGIYEEEESSLWWLWVILILIALVGGYFGYQKFKKKGGLFKKKSKTSFEQYQRQISQRPRPQVNSPQPIQRPIRPNIRSKEEDELDKSLKEAAKLLEGKK